MSEPMPPLWAWPALLIGQVHRPLARSVRPDVELIRRLPGRLADDVAPVVAVLIVVAVFSVVRLGIRDVFTESMPFLVLAVALGLIAPSLGVLLVILHAIADLGQTLAGTPPAMEPLEVVGLIAARLISYYLLWLLVVEIPLLARAVPWAAMTSPRPQREPARRAVAIVSSLVAAVLMTYVWTLAVPVLVRPVFTWGLGTPPTAEATGPAQQWGWVLVAVATAMVGTLSFVRLRLSRAEETGPVSFEDFEDFDVDQLEGGPSERAEVAIQVARHAFAVVVLGGLVSGIVELAVLAAALIVSRPLAMRVLALPSVQSALVWIPWIVRFIVGFGLSYAIGLLITAIRAEPFGNAELPMVVSVAVGLFIFQVLLNVEAAPRPSTPATGPSAQAAAAAAVVLALGVTLAVPAPAAADEIIEATGPLTQILISDDLNCQVAHEADESYAFFGDVPGACGTFVAVDGTLYSPELVPAGTSAVGTPYTPVSQERSGSGAPGDPYTVVTVVALGDTELTLTETDTYVVGGEDYQTDVRLENAGGSPVDAVVYRAADCFLQNDDSGFGSVDQAAGAVRCVAVADPDAVTPVPGPRIEEWVPLTPGSTYFHAGFGEVWTAVAGMEPFPNTCRCDEFIDNGAGLSWAVTVPPAGAVTVSHLTNFSPAGRSIIASPASIPAGSAAGVAAVGAAVAVGLSGSVMERSREDPSARRARGARPRPRDDRGLRGGLVKRLRRRAARLPRRATAVAVIRSSTRGATMSHRWLVAARADNGVR